MRRLVRIFILVLIVASVLFMAMLAYVIVSDRIAYNKVEITTALLREGRYDPREHFSFTRACVFPPGAGPPEEAFRSGYRELDGIVPESHTHWTLVLLDDSRKTYLQLYVQDPKVRFGGPIVCSPKLRLRTTAIDNTLQVEVDTQLP